MATLNVPRFKVTGSVTRILTDPQSVSNADVVIDRTVAGGLNSLTTNDTLTIAIAYSEDGGQTWFSAAEATFEGGVHVTKGVTLAQDTLGLGVGDGVPAGGQFRVTLTASVPVFIAATIITTKIQPQVPIQ